MSEIAPLKYSRRSEFYFESDKGQGSNVSNILNKRWQQLQGSYSAILWIKLESEAQNKATEYLIAVTDALW